MRYPDEVVSRVAEKLKPEVERSPGKINALEAVGMHVEDLGDPDLLSRRIKGSTTLAPYELKSLLELFQSFVESAVRESDSSLVYN